MAGKYTESQRRATLKYFQKLKERGIPRNHGSIESRRRYGYVNNTIVFIKKLFEE